jgi:tetratricopeptide (TPR) repeat protein
VPSSVAIDRESVLVAAQKFVEKKKYDKAIAEYQKILQVDPNDARTLLKVGDLQLKMEAYPESIATYERVGKFYAQQGFALKAIAVYKQIREIVGKHVPHLEERYGHIAPKLADLYQQLGLVSDALAALDEVATRLQRAQRDGEAIEIFKKIVALDPTNPLPHLRLAEAHSRARDADGAVSEFSVAASLLVRLGRRDDALKVLERLLHHRPEPAQARLAADLYLARGGPQDGMQALSKLQVCFQANPRDIDTLRLLAKAFGVIGQAAKGVEVQKEMARIARDQGKLDVMGEVVRELERIAPQDEAVSQLAQEYDDAVATRQATEAENEEPRIENKPQVPEPVPSDAEPFSLRDDAPELEEVGDAPEVIEEGQFELVEEIDEDVESRVQQFIEDARSFSRVRLFNKAIETLVSAAELDPRSIDVRVALRDAYLESNRQADAIVEMINVASLQLDALDGDGAAQTLQDVMTLDPTNARAAEMLRELGYELVEEPPPSLEATQAMPRERFDSYDPEAPLPSYDLEEIGPAHAMAPQPLPDVEANTNVDQPLPSFPLDAVESEAQFELVKEREEPPPPSMRSAAADIEEALEEAEFFASRGLFDDARAVLSEQINRMPNHPLLRERLAEIDAQEQAAQKGSGTRAVPRQPMGSVADDEAFDIAASLDALEALDVAPEAANLMNETGQVDVEEVFAKFKEGVSKQLSVDDGQAHYDLGLAYKEMGLIEDAKSEFDIAARDPNRECVCRSMIGTIWLESGELDRAIEAFQQGLAARIRTPEQETVLCFEIGAAYETKRMTREALSYFHRVARRDANYRDVEERIRRLSKPEVKPPVRALAVNAGEDEFDRAFDEMLGSDDDPKLKKKLS